MMNPFIEMIEMVEEKVQNHFESIILCRWARIRAEAGLMTVSDYFVFKTKLGMGY